MAQRRWSSEFLEVRLVAQSQEPVGHICQGGDHVVSDVDEFVAWSQRHERDQADDQYVQGWQQTSCSAEPEVGQVYATFATVFRDHQCRDEESTDDEEHLDTEIAARGPCETEVIGDDGEDRYRPETVDGGAVAKARPRVSGAVRFRHLPRRRGPSPRD